MIDLFSSWIGNDYLATVIMSFVPLIELKGGIVFALKPLSVFMAFLLAYVGSTIAFFPVYWLLVPILNGLKKIKWFNGFASKVENYFKNKADQTLKNQQAKNKSSKISETLLKQIGVFVFVAIPLPVTGVWTGTAIAVFLGLKFRHAILPVILGNLVAGGIILGLAELCLVIFGTVDVLDYILYALLGLAVIFLVVTILKISKSKDKKALSIEDAEQVQENDNQNKQD